MRALWGKAPSQFELREVPVPSLGTGDVLVRVQACGICGTDLHMQRGLNRAWAPLGHELASVVAHVSEGVTPSQPGDRVIIENNTASGVCDACKNGESRYCRNTWSFMKDQAGFGAYLCVPASSIQKYGALTPRQAARAEPLTVAIDVQLRASRAIPNHYFPIALDLLARKIVDADRLVTHTFSLNEYRQPFETAGNPDARVGKVCIEP